MTMYITNAFSANMLSPAVGEVSVTFQKFRDVGVVNAYIADARSAGHPPVSAVGHADTAALFSSLLGREVKANRQTVSLGMDDRLILGQYRGPRLPEGTTTLPEGATVDWYYVTVAPPVDEYKIRVQAGEGWKDEVARLRAKVKELEGKLPKKVTNDDVGDKLKYGGFGATRDEGE